MPIWDNWILVASAAPSIWAVVIMLDVYFVDSIYADEHAAVFLSGAFQLLPWIAVLWLGAPVFSNGTAVLAIAAGALFSFSNLFYFKSLFLSGDVAFIQVLWNGTSITTPIFAFLVSGERLSPKQYLGVGIVFAGATILSLRGVLRGKSKQQVGRNMTLAALLMSAALVAEAEVYRVLSFSEGFLLSTLGGFLAGLVCLAWRMWRHRGVQLLKGRGAYWLVFLAAELTALAGLVAYQRAINLAPSVSFFAVIESFLPVFVMVYSAAVCLLATMVNMPRAKTIFATQLSNPVLKVIAIASMAVGITLVE